MPTTRSRQSSQIHQAPTDDALPDDPIALRAVIRDLQEQLASQPDRVQKNNQVDVNVFLEALKQMGFAPTDIEVPKPKILN